MIVIADKPGQLGNMLILFSHFMARAIESDFTVSNLAFDDYADRFPTTQQDLLCRFPARKSWLKANRSLRKSLYGLSHFAVRLVSRLGGNLGPLRAITLRDFETEYPLNSPEFLNFIAGRLVFVSGWGFRDHEALKKHSDVVRELLRPPDINQRNIDELIARARRNANILIGVHIRHGIIHFDNTRKYFYSAKRYAEMMDELVTMFPDKRVAFLICSDWPQEPARFSRFNVTFGTGDLIEDMYGFARCDYLIGAPSTFTMWASFYGKVPLNWIKRPDQRQNIADFISMEDRL